MGTVNSAKANRWCTFKKLKLLCYATTPYSAYQHQPIRVSDKQTWASPHQGTLTTGFTVGELLILTDWHKSKFF